MFFKKHFFLVSLIFLLLIPYSALAKQLEVKDIENYLNNLTSIQANFLQYDSSNNVRSGSFYLLKPGKIRINYNTEDQEQIFLNKKEFVIYNPILDEISYIPTSRVPIKFLSSDFVRFGEKIKVLDMNQDKDYANLKLQMPMEDSELLNINVAFSKNPFNINSITYNDLISKKTIILKFIDLKTNIAINKRVFDFHNPRFNK